MNVERMLFAQARGATILKRDTLAWDPTVWTVAILDDFEGGDGYEYQIAPMDAHLQYGPISSALIDSAMYIDFPDDLTDLETLHYEAADCYLKTFDPKGHYYLSGLDDLEIYNLMDMYMLFIAEMLADIGL